MRAATLADVKHSLADWPSDTRGARALQESLTHRIREQDEPFEVRWIAGVDCHYDKPKGLAFAAVALLDAMTLELVESVLASRPLDFPYVPGLLSFREVPAALAALACLSRRPDLLMVDGQGRAHPRRIGLASHLGLLADLPAIGVAKSRLVGKHAEPALEIGASVPLEDKGEIIGAVLRTRRAVRPLYVSVGHRISLGTAQQRVLDAMRGYRLPEPTRIADLLSRCHG
jgi:deoxyribonuclease V